MLFYPLYSLHLLSFMLRDSFIRLLVRPCNNATVHAQLVGSAAGTTPMLCCAVRLIHYAMRFVCRRRYLLPTFYAYLSHGIVVIVVILTFVNFYASLPYCHSCIFALLIRTYALAFRFFSLSLSLALPLHLSLLSLYIAIKMQ